jgi:LysR family cys regulon transcriptional activator
LTQLRYLAAIVDSGLNITLAARSVHATQPGLSKQIKQLEDELGFLLFVRKGKSLDRISPAGALVVEHARSILAEAGNIRTLAANHREDAAGELRIATTHTQARFVLPGPLTRLKAAYPEVGVRLTQSGEMEVLNLLEHDNVDLAIVSSVAVPPAGDLALPLYRWDPVALVPRGHALSGLNRRLTLDDLAAFPLVAYDSALQQNSSLMRAFAAAGHEAKIGFTARDADLIKTYVRAGLGVGVLAEMALTPEDGADLDVLPLNGLLPTCTTWMILRRDRILRTYVLELVQALAPHIDPRAVRRALEHGEAPAAWPAAPRWRDAEERVGPLTAQPRALRVAARSEAGRGQAVYPPSERPRRLALAP